VLFCLLLFGWGGTVGCNPTYAPPVRTNHYGAPADFHRGRMEANVSYMNPAGTGLDGSLGLALTDAVQLELGGNFGVGAITYVGVRFSSYQKAKQQRLANVLFDFETGAGLGVGGELCGDDPESVDDDECAHAVNPPWYRRIAGGAYFGVGLGVEFDIDPVFKLSIYSRARLQITKAQYIPTTTWVTAGGGLELTFSDFFKLYGGPYYAMYDNSMDGIFGCAGEVGIKFVFDVF